MPFATLTPREGAVHSPSGGGQAWAFPLGGTYHPINDEKGRPRPFSVEVAEHAVSWFTPDSGECLVEMHVHEGELEYRLPEAPAPIVCDECGGEFTVSEIQAHVRACVLNSQKPAPDEKPAAKAHKSH